MVEGYWKALWPLILIVLAPEFLTALGAAVVLAVLVLWGVRRKRRRQQSHVLVLKGRRHGLRGEK